MINFTELESNLEIFGQLPSGFNHLQLLEMLCSQVEKDLSMPEEHLSPIELTPVFISRMKSKMIQWLEMHPDKTDAWCYRVDLFRKDMNEFKRMNGAESLQFLTDAILNRELKKVITRLASRHFEG